MAEHELDEGAQALTQQARMAMMIAGRMVEMVARRRADQDRAAADEARDRAATASRAADRLERQDRSATREATRAGGREQDRGRQAAHQVYAPLTNPRTFAGAEPETVAAGYTLATVWADRDPRAATATEQLDALCEDRWGVPARRLTRATGSTERESEVATAAKEVPRDLLERARDDRWRERGSSEDLAAAWQAASIVGDNTTREALETTMGTRFGFDVEDYLRKVRSGQEDQAVPGDAAWLTTQNGSDRALAEREATTAAAEQSLVKKFSHDLAEERVNDPEGERFNSKPDTGLQDTPALRGGQARADDEAARQSQAAAAARTRADSRADQAAMREHQVPAAAKLARATTAPAFGTRTVDGVRSNVAKAAVRVGTGGRESNRVKDRGRS
ncbi:MAG: hypothetical protein WBA72_06965 [Ornithinimicrobium sp.]